MNNSKEWIDKATYQELLQRWRFAPLNDEIFTGELGAYYEEVMWRKKSEISQSEAVSASKNIGW